MLIAGIRGKLVMEPGFRTDRVFLATIDPQLLKYSAESSRQLYGQLFDRVRALPGVRSVTLANTPPTANGGVRFFRIVPEGYVLPRDQRDVSAFETLVAEDYFDTIGIPVLAGRAILPAVTDGGGLPSDWITAGSWIVRQPVAPTATSSQVLCIA